MIPRGAVWLDLTMMLVPLGLYGVLHATVACTWLGWRHPGALAPRRGSLPAPECPRPTTAAAAQPPGRRRRVALLRTDPEAARELGPGALALPALVAWLGPVPVWWALAYNLPSRGVGPDAFWQDWGPVAACAPALSWAFVLAGALFVRGLLRAGWAGALPVLAAGFVLAELPALPFLIGELWAVHPFCDPVPEFLQTTRWAQDQCGSRFGSSALATLPFGVLGLVAAGFGWVVLAITRPEAVARREAPPAKR